MITRLEVDWQSWDSDLSSSQVLTLLLLTLLLLCYCYSDPTATPERFEPCSVDWALGEGDAVMVAADAPVWYTDRPAPAAAMLMHVFGYAMCTATIGSVRHKHRRPMSVST